MTTGVAASTVLASPADLAELVLGALPSQGQWSEEEYLWLTDRSRRLIEFTAGYIEVLPRPTDKHQAIVQFLFLAFLAALQPIGAAAVAGIAALIA